MTFFVMNLACFLLKIGSAPNFRPGFKFFSWQTAFAGSLLSAAAMFFIDEAYASMAICVLVFVFLLIHYFCPPKRWGDVSQNLIYHQVRKYLLRLKPEHIKFWRPHIILLINDPRRQTRLIQFCNSMKKGSLYILGHVIVTDDFGAGVQEARLQQQAWTNYISEFSRIKAFVQLTMSPSITWGIRNLILSAGLGGMRPNIGVMGFYNMNDLRKSNHPIQIPDIPSTTASKMLRPQDSEGKAPRRRRGDTSARLLEGVLPTDVIRTEKMMSPTEYMTMLEDLALKYRLNVGVAYGFDKLEPPRRNGDHRKKYIDLWPIQMSAEVSSDGRNVLTTNFDTYTLILQLGHILRSVQTWGRAYSLRVMVFVEYESEVEEERGRVKVLLEKLRIDAEVEVFWLASGQLKSYELVVNGNSTDMDWEVMVNETLKDEPWWDEMQTLRGQTDNMTSSQEIRQLTHILDTSLGRPGLYNPHEDHLSRRRRRSSVVEFPDVVDLPKNPAISTLSKMGVSVGIHTNRSTDEVLLDSDSEFDSMSESSASESDLNPELASTSMQNQASAIDHTQQPLLGAAAARIQQDQEDRDSGSSSAGAARTRKHKASTGVSPPFRSYGTTSTSLTLNNDSEAGSSQQPPGPGAKSETPVSRTGHDALDDVKDGFRAEAHQPFPPFDIPQAPNPPVRQARSVSFSEATRSRSTGIAPAVSALQKHTSDFPVSNCPTHVNTTTREEENLSDTAPYRLRTALQQPEAAGQHGFSKHGYTQKSLERPENTMKKLFEGEGSHQAGASDKPDNEKLTLPKRLSHSRQSSYGRFSSRPVPESHISGGEDGTRTITFAERPTYHSYSANQSRHHSRQGSAQLNLVSGDASLKIPELLESYRAGGQSIEEEGHSADGGSSYSTQGLSLSFNDLPSRAQHLILNELMRIHSSDTAVLLSTLPIPSEGTSLDELASVQYLSDVEVLCHGLPPILMVLSNNMTVTVSL